MADDGYANVSYEVFNIGEANHLPGVSMELGRRRSRAAATSRRSTASSRSPRGGAERGKLVHTSPIALRFVAPSDAYASMMHGQPTMMIELIMVDGTRGGDELLAGYEERARRPRRAPALGPDQRAHARAGARALPALGRLAGGRARAQPLGRLRLAVQLAGRVSGARSKRTLSDGRPSAVAALTKTS